MALNPLPNLALPVLSPTNPGAFDDPWNRYFLSLDTQVRAQLSPTGLTPLPSGNVWVVDPQSGMPTLFWVRYIFNLDSTLRNSSWNVLGKTASQVLTPLPPMITAAMVLMPGGFLVAPWAQYFASVDALARPN